MFRNFKMVSYVVFGRGCFNQLDGILAKRRRSDDSFMVYMVDDVFKNNSLENRVPIKNKDKLKKVGINFADIGDRIYGKNKKLIELARVSVAYCT